MDLASLSLYIVAVAAVTVIPGPTMLLALTSETAYLALQEAIFAVTHDPFIVYTSNIFAMLGLRALYFLLAGVMGLFRYLHYGLAAVLIFVGCCLSVTSTMSSPFIPFALRQISRPRQSASGPR